MESNQQRETMRIKFAQTQTPSELIDYRYPATNQQEENHDSFQNINII